MSERNTPERTRTIAEILDWPHWLGSDGEYYAETPGPTIQDIAGSSEEG